MASVQKDSPTIDPMARHVAKVADAPMGSLDPMVLPATDSLVEMVSQDRTVNFNQDLRGNLRSHRNLAGKAVSPSQKEMEMAIKPAASVERDSSRCVCLDLVLKMRPN